MVSTLLRPLVAPSITSLGTLQPPAFRSLDRIETVDLASIMYCIFPINKPPPSLNFEIQVLTVACLPHNPSPLRYKIALSAKK